MKDLVSTLLELVGMAMATAGCWLLSPWLGLVVGGLLLMFIGWLVGAPQRPAAPPRPAPPPEVTAVA